MKAKFLAARIRNGYLSIEQVPDELRADVERWL